MDVPPCYEDAIKLNNSASKVVAVHALKHVTTTATMTSNDASGKNATSTFHNRPTERTNSSQLAAISQPCDDPDFSASEQRTISEKCDPSSQNSSQTENALAKVLRKSIRGIRRLRNGGDENSAASPSNNGPTTCTLESGLSDTRTSGQS